MTLKQRVQDDLIQAMRDKDATKKGVLQLVKAGFNNAEREAKMELNDKQLLSVIQKEIKQTVQALEGAVTAQRDDLIKQEEYKIALLATYLPEQLDETQITLRLQNRGVVSGMNMGEAMKIAKQAIGSGEADAKTVSTIVKEIIKGS